MNLLGKSIQAVFAGCGLRVTRLLPANRFDAMSSALGMIARAGFEPTVIVDAGANIGQWARKVSDPYPAVSLHLIEPQAACRPALLAFAAARGSTEVYTTAVTGPGRTSLRMTGATAGSTGARILHEAERGTDEIWLPATTLDQLLADRVGADDRVLLKLDLEGHEIEALNGAEILLRRVEVLVIETQFYQVERNGDATFAELMAVLGALGFVFYDVAALASRPRDGRLRMGDVIFVRQGSALIGDDRWA
jgi:FkbM family methyltransferase